MIRDLGGPWGVCLCGTAHDINPLGSMLRVEYLLLISLIDVEEHSIANVVEEGANYRERGHHFTTCFEEIHYLRVP
jgi:hypothetical protein